MESTPVTGHIGGPMEVLPCNKRYVKKEETVIKLEDMARSCADFTITALNKHVWFKIKSEKKGQRTLMNSKGVEIAGYKKKSTSLHNTAYITGEIAGKTVVYATVKQSSYLLNFGPRVDVYIHKPPVDMYDATTDGLVPDMKVKGNLDGKNYSFKMGSMKVAQVLPKWMNITENNCYFVNIGKNMDIAFICMCAMAVDEISCEAG